MTPAINESTEQLTRPDNDEHVVLTADQLADLIENDPVAIRALRQLILEGLESGDDGEADDDWLESLKDGVRQRAASRK